MCVLPPLRQKERQADADDILYGFGYIHALRMGGIGARDIADAAFGIQIGRQDTDTLGKERERAILCC